MELINQIQQLSEQYFEEIRDVRHHLHAHPELSFEEYQTAELVQRKLSEFDIPFQAKVAKTGVVGMIAGKNPTKKVIALRADMDALPILEENEVPYKSKNEGVMHACGHDVHTSSLLGAAKILNQIKAHFEGSIKLIFQPSEERLPGGASVMIEEGVLESPTTASIIGQHVHPPLEVGKVGFCPGMSMASADELYFTVKGKGGHAAVPHDSIDPILIASHIVINLQHLVSRRANPYVPTVLTIGKMVGGTANNIIPYEVKMEGTLRTMNEEWRSQMHEHIHRVAKLTAESMGGSCELDIKVGYPYLVNDEELTARCQQMAEAYMGKENVVPIPPRMTAEDFAYYTHHTKGCFYRLGVANAAKGIGSPVHTPTFDIDEAALKTGMGLMAWLAVNNV